MNEQPALLRFYFEVWRRFAEFSGRSSRRAYWHFILANTIVQFTIGFMNGLSGGSILFTIVGLVYAFAVMIPSLAVAVRRLHDTNRSGFWMFLAFLPIIGWIWLFVLMVLPSVDEGNRFGPPWDCAALGLSRSTLGKEST